jgi:glc operon protein GlcG
MTSRRGILGAEEDQTDMIDMTLAMAERAVRAAQDKARQLGTAMTVTVVDESGRLVLAARGDGTGFFTPETSRAKAVAAAAFRMPTSDMAERAQKGSLFYGIAPTVLAGQILPSHGGVPILASGRVIGGIGCGGGTGEQDHECAVAGAAAVKS